MNKKKKKFKITDLLYLLALAAGVVVVIFMLNMADQYEVVVQNGTGSGKYKVGDTVTATIMEKDAEFTQWEIDYGSIKISDLTQTTVTFEMPDKNVGITALFIEEWTEKDGTQYKGTRVGKANDGAGMIEYTGSAIFANGDTYEGEWHNGKMSGDGLYTWVDENGVKTETYEGEFINDRVAGKGTSTYFDKDGNVTETFTGNFLSAERSGEGKAELFEDGVVVESYDGVWSKDVPGGEGTYMWFEDGVLVNKFVGTITGTVVDEEAHTYTYTFEGTYTTFKDGKEESSVEVTADKAAEDMKEVGIAQQ